jgi:hypothetical protein
MNLRGKNASTSECRAIFSAYGPAPGSAKPGYLTTLGYAARWGIEPMFSDFTSRGFGREQTHLRYPDRLARLIPGLRP